MRADRTPVIAGVGQVLGNRDRTVAGAREPLRLIADAAHAAAADVGEAGGRLLRELDAVSATHPAGWPYADLPARLAERLAAAPSVRATGHAGGHAPAVLLDAAARRIAVGRTRSELVAGGEASASLAVLAKAGVDPAADLGWADEPGPDAAATPDPGSPGPLEATAPAMQRAGLVLPTRVYPMVDTAFAHARGETPAQLVAAAADYYAALSRVAAANPAAWNPVAREPEELVRVAPGNRMVCEPYPLALNAMPHVDQAAAVLVTSLAVAREHGIPDERLVHVWGGAGTAATADVLARRDLGRSVALAACLDRALAAAGLAPAELDVIDLYACFPVLPRLAACHLRLPLAALVGATGGQQAFGGPASSYTLHSVVACAHRVRTGARTALVHGNGGYLTWHHAVVLARRPHPQGYVGDPEPHAVDDADPQAPPVLPPGDGETAEVRLEAATVEYDRDGAPAQGFLVGRTSDGRRVAAATPRGNLVSLRPLSLYPHGVAEPPGPHVVGTRVRLTGVAGLAQVEPLGP